MDLRLDGLVGLGFTLAGGGLQILAPRYSILAWIMVVVGIGLIAWNLWRWSNAVGWQWRRPWTTAPARMSLATLRDEARRQGWDFDSQNSLQAFDFANALRQAGLDGALDIWGRPDRNMFVSLTKDEPLNRIPPEHWKDYQVEPISLLRDNNFETRSYSPRTGDFKGFVDLHVSGRDALKWLKTEAVRFRGRKKP